MEDREIQYLTTWKDRFRNLLVECFGKADDELLGEGFKLIDDLFEEFKTFDDDYILLDEKYICRLENLMNSRNEKIEAFVRNFTSSLANEQLAAIIGESALFANNEDATNILNKKQ